MTRNISIVIPAYNESARLAATLDRVLAFVHQQGWDSEIIVVDDGSRDNTAEIVNAYAQKDGMVRLLQNPGNRGKGYAVRNGVVHAHGDIVLFTDADLSAPIEEAPKLLQALDEGADVAIGSRWLRSELQTRRQSLLRQGLGRLFNLLLRMLLRLDLKDTQCGFKAFRREAALPIFPKLQIERWGFDPEILFLANDLGLRVAEVPVVWAHDDRTRIHPLADGSRMVADMLKIRWYSVTGVYDGKRRRASTATVSASQRPRT